MPTPRCHAVIEPVSDSILDFFDNKTAWLLTLDRGASSEQTYVGRWKVCDNPLCSCTEMDFFAMQSRSTEMNEAKDASQSAEVLSFSLDVMKREFASAKDARSRILGRKVARQLTPADWTNLARLLYSTKANQIRKADLETLDARFPKATVNDGTMVGYIEIFPLAPALGLELEGRKYIADDMYCVQQGCTCNQAALTFLPVDGDTAPSHRHSSAVRYSFQKGMTEVLRESDPGQPAVRELVRALEQAEPNLSRELVFRHQQLSTLFRKRHASPQSPSPERTKVGRNDPCPCGSGRKFKKCCGR